MSVRKTKLAQVAFLVALGLMVDSSLKRALAQTESPVDSAVSDVEATPDATPVGSDLTPTIALDQDLDNVSYQASDLLAPTDGIDLAQRPVDLDEFCTNYPYNSRCENYTPSTPTEEAETNRPSSESSANSPWAVGTDISTLGFGASATRRITPRVNVRGAINGFSFGTDIDDTDVSYDVDLTLINVSTLVDYHPVKNLGLRLTGGLIFNDNKLEGSGRPSGAIGDQTFTFDGTDYSLSDVGSVDAEVDFGSPVAPYIGIGWGNAVRPGQRWGFSANLGVMFPGSPSIDITPNTSLVGTELADLQADIDAEERKLEDDLDILKVYPILSVGLTYHF